MRRNDVVRVRTSNGLETRITENHSLFSFGEQGELIPVEPAANKFVALVSDVPASEGIEEVDLLSEMKATLPAAEYEKIYCSLSGMSQAKVREMKSELSVLANARAGSFENISSACALDVSTVACVAKRLEKDNMATVARKGRKKVLELLPSGRKRLAFLQWYARNVRYYKGKYRASADAVLGEEFDARVNGQIRIESAYCKTKLRRRLSITPALCRYFGFYVSEGYSGHDKKHSRVFLAACKPAMRNRMMESVERGLKLPCRESQKGVALDSHFGFLLTRHVFGCGAGAYEKEIPAIVFNASNECKWAFLDAYFSGDGYVSKKGSVIVLTTASRKLAAGLVFLLRQLEIKKVTVRKDRVYRVNIFEPLPFARADESRGKKAYYNTVPSALRSKTAFAKFGNDYIASESHLKARMKTAKVSPVCFDYIKSISKIEVQPKYVYDIGVERTERFAGGIGLLALHNSIGEEGLDIPRVDMVVFYESVPSEVRLIQRRGRAGRVRAGKVVMLVTKGTKDEAFLWIARRKEKQMHEHMRSLKKSLESGGSDEVFAGTAFDRKQKRMDEFF
jgi:intein/homing endonuclease